MTPDHRPKSRRTASEGSTATRALSPPFAGRKALTGPSVPLDEAPAACRLSDSRAAGIATEIVGSAQAACLKER